jgi:hypothetical protein
LISLNNQVLLAGNYELKSSGQLLTVPSFNFNRNESVMSFNTADDLNEKITQLRLKQVSVIEPGEAALTAGFTFMNEGTRLWKYCIMLVLMFLAIEIMLLKFRKP